MEIHQEVLTSIKLPIIPLPLSDSSSSSPPNIGLCRGIRRCKKLSRKPFRKFPSNFPWNMKIIEVPLSLSLLAPILGKRISSIDLSFLSILFSFFFQFSIFEDPLVYSKYGEYE